MQTLPKTTPSQQIGARGEALADAELSMIAVCNRMDRDYGLDILCHLLEGSNVTALAFFVQVKSFDSSWGDTKSISLKVSSLRHWYASTIPVYIVLCFLRGRSRLFWLSVTEAVARQFDSLEALAAQNQQTVSLTIDSAIEMDNKSLRSLTKDVRKFHNRLDESIKAMLTLRDRQPSWIENSSIPKEFERLGFALTYYYSTPPETRASLLETYFDTWEKIENRFAYGYPVGNLRVAFYMCHNVALRSALKTLYYMESDVIHWIHDEMSYVRDHLDYCDRVRALRESIVHFHCTPYVGNPDFDDIVAGKIAVIASWIFEPDRVVPTLRELYEELREPLEDIWLNKLKKLHHAGPNMVSSLYGALKKLRWFKQADPIIPSMAIDQFDRDIINEKGWRWEQRVHIISYHTLHEPRIPRTFDDMIPEAQKLILDGLRRHTDPAVRLDCLKVLNRELDKYGAMLERYIKKTSKETQDADELKRLKCIGEMLDEFLCNGNGKRRA